MKNIILNFVKIQMISQKVKEQAIEVVNNDLKLFYKFCDIVANEKIDVCSAARILIKKCGYEAIEAIIELEEAVIYLIYKIADRISDAIIEEEKEYHQRMNKKSMFDRYSVPYCPDEEEEIYIMQVSEWRDQKAVSQQEDYECYST